MHYRIDELETFGDAVRECLGATGLRSTRQLLEKCGTPEGRVTLARSTRLTEAQILRCVHIADLLRVKGVGDGYVALLEAGGITDLAGLRSAKAAALLAHLQAAKAKLPRVRRAPTLAEVQKWIADAGALQPVVK